MRARTVVDASALVEVLLRTPIGRSLADALRDADARVHALAHTDLEVLSALRGLCRSSQLTAERADRARGILRDLIGTRHVAEPLLDRIWELRDNFTAYDAAYVALAEALDATLVTTDARLADATRRHTGVPLLS